MSFTPHTYPEVLDHVLTSVTAGVAAEPHPFPPPGASGPPYRHSLLRPPAAEVVSVYANRGGASHLFRPDRDYTLADDGSTLEWLADAELPDRGTVVRVSYYPSSAQPVLTDIRSGSVIRTLCEATALEIARLYAQLEAVYKAGFIDTANGSALDKVVALLDIHRVPAGRSSGEIELTRSPNSRGAIHIPAGTRVLTVDGNVEYETTAAATLADGQRTLRLPIRDLEANDPLPADALRILPIPIAGISDVSNPEPTSLTNREENDRELRQRAKSFFHGSERATLGAIEEAIARQGITADVVESSDQPGLVQVVPHAEHLSPEQRQRLATAIRDVQPAGVRVEILGTKVPRKVDLGLVLTTVQDLPEEDLRGAHQTVRAEIEDYFDRLPAKAAGSINQLVSRVLAVSGVEDVRLSTASWVVGEVTESVLDLPSSKLTIAGFPTVLGELSIADPNLPTQVDVVLTYHRGDLPDRLAIEAALETAIGGDGPLPPDAIRIVAFQELLEAIRGVGPAPQSAAFVFVQASGLTRELSEAGDEYEMIASERLSLRGVILREEDG